METELILAISGSIITILLGAIGYFLRQFALSVKELKKTVDAINTMITVESERVANMKEKVTTNERRLNEHGKVLDIHDRKIAIVETKICK